VRYSLVSRLKGVFRGGQGFCLRQGHIEGELFSPAPFRGEGEKEEKAIILPLLESKGKRGSEWVL